MFVASAELEIVVVEFGFVPKFIHLGVNPKLPGGPGTVAGTTHGTASVASGDDGLGTPTPGFWLVVGFPTVEPPRRS